MRRARLGRWTSLLLVFAFCCCKYADVDARHVRRLHRLAAEHGIWSQQVHDTTEVYVNGKRYEIYTGPVSPKGDGTNSLANHLYTCVGCVFAHWTRARLLALVELVPVLYQKQLEDIHKRVFASELVGNKKKFLGRQVLKRLQRFVDVQTEFLRAYWSDNDGSPPDASLIATLLTLIMTAEYMNASHNRSEFGMWTDKSVVHTMMKALNGVQYYLNVNCKLTTHYDNKQLYGISKRSAADDGTDDDTKVDQFIESVVQPLRLDASSTRQCGVYRSLLADVISSAAFKPVRWVTDWGEMMPSKALAAVTGIFDLAIVLWYQKYVYATITKTLLHSVAEHYSDTGHLSGEIVNAFANLLSQSGMYFAGDAMPAELAECFQLLIVHDPDTAYSESDSLLASIRRYMDTLPIVLHVHAASEAIGTLTDTGAGGAMDALPERFMAYLESVGDDLRCFVRLYEYL